MNDQEKMLEGTNTTHPFGAISDLPGRILAGEWDGEMEAIGKALNARQAAIISENNARAAVDLQEGDEVRLGEIRPKYMQGAPGEIAELHDDDTVSVRLTEGRRRYGPGTVVRVPASGVVVVCQPASEEGIVVHLMNGKRPTS